MGLALSIVRSIFEIVPDVLDIVVVVEHIEHLLELGVAVLVLELGVGVGDHFQFSGSEGVSELFELISDSGEILGLGVDGEHIVVCLKVRCSDLKRVAHNGVFVLFEFLALDHEHAFAVEHEAYATLCAHIAAKLVKVVSDLARGSVAVVGQRLDDDRDAADAVALIGEFSRCCRWERLPPLPSQWYRAASS